jgi:hypothetical protein
MQMAEYNNEREGDRNHQQGKKLSEPTLWKSCGNECNNLFACKNPEQCSCVHPNVCLEYIYVNNCPKRENCENFHPIICQKSYCFSDCPFFHVTSIEITRWFGEKQMDEQTRSQKEHEHQTIHQTYFLPSMTTQQVRSQFLQKREIYYRFYQEAEIKEQKLNSMMEEKRLELEKFKCLPTRLSGREGPLELDNSIQNKEEELKKLEYEYNVAKHHKQELGQKYLGYEQEIRKLEHKLKLELK